MTLEEFKALQNHVRVKYIGSDTKVLDLIAKQAKVAATKGIVVSYVYDYGTKTTTSGWGTSMVTHPGKGLCLRAWSGTYFENCVPTDWEVVDASRKDLVRSRAKRKVVRTDSWVKGELQKFSDQFRAMKSTKELIDMWLDNIPLTDRLKILTTLSEEQQAWLQLVSMDPEEVITMLKKIATEEPQDEPVLPSDTVQIVQSEGVPPTVVP